MGETQLWSLGLEDPLEKGTAMRSSIRAWRIPWTEEPGGIQAIGSQRVGHDWAFNTHAHCTRCVTSAVFFLNDTLKVTLTASLSPDPRDVSLCLGCTHVQCMVWPWDYLRRCVSPETWIAFWLVNRRFETIVLAPRFGRFSSGVHVTDKKLETRSFLSPLKRIIYNILFFFPGKL